MAYNNSIHDHVMQQHPLGVWALALHTTEALMSRQHGHPSAQTLLSKRINYMDFVQKRFNERHMLLCSVGIELC